MKKIILSIHNGIWIAEQLTNNKPCPNITLIFGTHILPTAFTVSTPSDEVQKIIQSKNPQAIVEVR